MEEERKTDKSLSSSSNGDYGRKEYWDKRYEDDEEFEWCKEYAVIKPLLEKELNMQDKILILGCGNSDLSQKLYENRFHLITNIDFSSIVISKMSKKLPCMDWYEMDMLNLNFPEETFDVVIEKSALDVLFVDEKSPWDVSDAVAVKMDQVLGGVCRVLKKGGKFVSITFAQPHFRHKFYKKYWNNCTFSTFGEGFHYYFYVNSGKL